MSKDRESSQSPDLSIVKIESAADRHDLSVDHNAGQGHPSSMGMEEGEDGEGEDQLGEWSKEESYAEDQADQSGSWQDTSIPGRVDCHYLL